MTLAALILAVISLGLHVARAAAKVIGQTSVPKIEIILKDERTAPREHVETLRHVDAASNRAG
ncbi:MAG TPA: hypothetical protein VLZ74_03025 [Methylocella sp.]|nr:hypothetical protein [Methylocella sp.]